MEQFLIVKVGQGRMININDCIPLSQVISARKGEFETGFERGGQTRWEEVFLFGFLCTNHVKLVSLSSPV